MNQIDNTKKEIATTIYWGAGIIVAIILQTIVVAWYFAQQDATIRLHTQEIAKMINGQVPSAFEHSWKALMNKET